SRWVRLNSVIITFSGFKSGTCQRYSGRVNGHKKSHPYTANYCITWWKAGLAHYIKPHDL
ncbi:MULTISPECIES: hypothetical protein, partial [Salmonella]|uniref:hypothetical protein n=1 Tax=Salmonella TaxID=590 RepID=UPI001C3880A0